MCCFEFIYAIFLLMLFLLFSKVFTKVLKIYEQPKIYITRYFYTLVFTQTIYQANSMSKLHLLLSGNNKVTANIDGNIIESEESQVLLGVTIDSNLSFDKHINNLCKNASAKLNAVARIAGYTDIKKRRMTMKAFITSQFSYCPLIWIFHSRELNNKISTIHDRSLRITYNDRASELY